MIERCVCRDVSFEEAKTCAVACGARTLDQLMERVDIADGCGLCRPYLAVVLSTGKVAFEE